jgi:hypothetical protein
MLLSLPKKVQMKYLIIARVFASLMFEPSTGLWNALMERTDGRLPLPVEHTGAVSAEIGVKLIDYRLGIAEAETRPGSDSETPRQDEGLGDGA